MSYPEEPQGPALVIQHTGQVFPLGAEPVTIGSAEDNLIILDDPQVAAHHATIVWHGTGGIVYPAQFEPPGSFEASNDTIDKPQNSQYFEYTLDLGETELAERTDSAWAAVSTLQLTEDFEKTLPMRTFRAGFYLYPPTVGVFDPASAKWIIFLYRGNQ